jgi:hypothetical protein
VLQEAPEELHGARLGDLREEERQLAERAASRRQSREGALDAQRDLLESIVRQALERLTGGVARLRILDAQDVDEEIDRGPAVQVREQRGGAHQADGLLLRVELLRAVHLGAKRGDERLGVLDVRLHQARMHAARGALGFEQGREIGRD